MTEPTGMDVLTDKIPQIRCCQCQSVIDVSEAPAFSQVQCPSCNAAQIVPARLGGFLLLDLIGRGGMGAVYRALDESLNRMVAIKVLLRSVGEDRESLETFRREGQAAAALNHPNIVQIYAFGEEKGQPFMVMELLVGGRIDKMMAGGQPLDPAFMLKVGMEVAEGLNAATGIGLSHGDVKPENILLDSNGVAKVVDFGLARFRDRAAKADGVWGTPYYIAPEKVRGQRTDDARSDIYSLGATLFHALAGRPPFDGQTPLDVVKARLEQPVPQLGAALPGFNPEFEAIITRMLQPEPLKRYPTYASLLADLRKLAETLRPREAPGLAGKGKKGRVVIIKGKPVRMDASDSGPIATPTVSHAASSPGKKKRKGGVGRAIAWLVVLGVVAGGITGGCMLHRKRVAARLAEAAERKARSDAVAAVSGAFAALESDATNRLGTARTARDELSAVSNRLAAAADLGRASTAASNALTALVDPFVVITEAEEATADIRASTSAIREVLEEARSRAESARYAKTSKDAAQILADIEAATTNLQAYGARLEGYVATLREAGAAAEEAAQKAGEAQTANAAQAERERAAKAEAARAAADKAKAERESAERKKRIAEEQARVKAAYEASAPAIKSNQYREAIAAILSASGSAASDEARADLQAVTNRLVLLQDLKGTIVRQLAAGPYRWGWATGSSAVDVLGADDTAVKLAGRSVPWSDVPPAQMLRFIRHFVTEGDLPRKELARMNLAAAAFCYEHGGAKPAREYADKAVALNSDLRPLAAQIMPDLGVGN